MQPADTAARVAQHNHAQTQITRRRRPLQTRRHTTKLAGARGVPRARRRGHATASDAANDTASTDAARALAGDRAKLLTGGADGDALRALVALLSGAVVPDDAAAAAGGARVLAGDDGPLIQVLAAATLDPPARAAAAAAYQSMRLAAGCEPEDADTAENILAADKIAADTDATIEL